MKVIGVSYNFIPKIEYYQTDLDFNVGDFCLVESSRGLEFAKVVKLNCEEQSENKVMRKATAEDRYENQKNIELGNEVKSKIKDIIKNFNLKMKLCKCEYTFDKEKLIIHYTADERVDFRELVKVLASEFHSRIEMHQINSRDETQLMGAMGCCGRVCCCKNHLCDFTQVSIKMAKKQGLSLNPQKLNGICGKLLCCLKYEDDYYSEMQEKMPNINAKVSTPDGEGTVKSCDYLKETVEVLFIKGDETERKIYNYQDLNFSKEEND